MDGVAVQVNDWNDNAVTVPLWQLLQWKAALRLESQGMRHSRGSVATHVRRLLSAPSSYTTRELAAYIAAVVDDVHAQLGT